MRSYRHHFALDSQIGSEMHTDLKDLIFELMDTLNLELCNIIYLIVFVFFVRK